MRSGKIPSCIKDVLPIILRPYSGERYIASFCRLFSSGKRQSFCPSRPNPKKKQVPTGIKNLIFFNTSFPFTRTRLITLAVVTAIAMCVNIIGMITGITVLLSHVIYVPIILAGYWFPLRGLIFSTLIAVTYGALITLILPLDLLLIISTLFRMTFFILIGGEVSFLSAKLRGSEEQLHEIIEFLPSPTFAINRKGEVIAWNQAVEDLTGVKKTEILNKGDYAYSHAFYGIKRLALVDLILSPNPETEAWYPQIRKEGKKLYLRSLSPVSKGGKEFISGSLQLHW